MGVALIYLTISINMTVRMRQYAKEKALNQLSQDETEIVLHWSSLSDQNLPASYIFFNEAENIMFWVSLFVAMYAAWTALDIPDRYQKETKEKQNLNRG